MFSVLDSGDERVNRSATTADRACDQCKARKVKCDMKKPCIVCSSKGFECTFDKARKKRGPTGKRIQEIRRMQSRPSEEATQSQSFPGHAANEFVASTPSSNEDPWDVQRATNVSAPDALEAGMMQASTQGPYWPSAPTPQPYPSDYAPGYTQNVDLAGVPASATHFPETTGMPLDGFMSSPNMGEFIFPSLPIDSPEGSWNQFGSLLQQDLPSVAANISIWPSTINEETLLPWIDVYFKRLHPTIPILSRTTMYHEMLMRKHHTDPQYGAMLLGLCAFAMTQPVQIHERADVPSRSIQARMLMEECAKMRVAADFGEHPSMDMILTSFFLFACLFGNGQHKAARHKLREAVDLAYSLGLHLPQSYEGLDAEAREQWLRTYLVLSVTERAYALQQRHSIDFRGRPGMTAHFMQDFDPNAATAYISSLIYQDQSDAVGMTGLMYLMESFDAIDESVIECWNGYCKYSDGACDRFDRRRALQMFRAQHRAREASITGNTSFAPSASPLPLASLMESQQADISITQLWLLNRLWNLCLSHGLLRESSDNPELQHNFACHIARALIATSASLSLSAMETHGVGFAEKVYDIAIGITTAMDSHTIAIDTLLVSLGDSALSDGWQIDVNLRTVRDLLHSIEALLQTFRGGEHPYSTMLSTAIDTIPGSRG